MLFRPKHISKRDRQISKRAWVIVVTLVAITVFGAFYIRLNNNEAAFIFSSPPFTTVGGPAPPTSPAR